VTIENDTDNDLSNTTDGDIIMPWETEDTGKNENETEHQLLGAD